MSKAFIRPIAVTVSEACELTRFGVTSIYAMIKTGKLQSIRVGGKRLILMPSIEDLLRPEPKPVEAARSSAPRGRPRKISAQQPTI